MAYAALIESGVVVKVICVPDGLGDVAAYVRDLGIDEIVVPVAPDQVAVGDLYSRGAFLRPYFIPVDAGEQE